MRAIALCVLLVAAAAPLHAAETPGCAAGLVGSYQFAPDILDLVRNGGGEAGMDADVYGWERWAPGADAEALLARDEATKGAGRTSLRVSQPDAGHPARWQQEIGAPAPGLKWRLAAQLCGRLGPGSRAYVRCTPAGRPDVLAELSAGDLSTQWKEWSAELPVSPDLQRLSLSLGIEGSGDAWFDEVSITPTDAGVDAAEQVELLLPLPPATQGQQPLALQSTIKPEAPEATGTVETTDTGVEVIRLKLDRGTSLMWVRWIVTVLVSSRADAACTPDTPISQAGEMPDEVTPFCGTAYLQIPECDENANRRRLLDDCATFGELAQCCAGMLAGGQSPSAIEGTGRWRDVDGYALGPLEFMAAACRLKGAPARIVTAARSVPTAAEAGRSSVPVVRRVEVWVPKAGWVPFPDVANEGKANLWIVLGVLRPGKETQPDPLREGRPLVMAGGKPVGAPLMDRDEVMAGWAAGNNGGPVLSDAEVKALAPQAGRWWHKAGEAFVAGQMPAPVMTVAVGLVVGAASAEDLARRLGE
jgi:hypothetical protein